MGAREPGHPGIGNAMQRGGTGLRGVSCGGCMCTQDVVVEHAAELLEVMAKSTMLLTLEAAPIAASGDDVWVAVWRLGLDGCVHPGSV
eukprot:3740563-Prorocentrum_lima.AAC.1